MPNKGGGGRAAAAAAVAAAASAEGCACDTQTASTPPSPRPEQQTDSQGGHRGEHHRDGVAEGQLRGLWHVSQQLRRCTATQGFGLIRATSLQLAPLSAPRHHTFQCMSYNSGRRGVDLPMAMRTLPP